MTGFVSFVSSGPGDPELLTLKAVARLQAADAVLFDDLSSGPVLTHARQGADLVGVGKRAGRASPKQDHVSRLLVDYARTGAKVVRLKSGHDTPRTSPRQPSNRAATFRQQLFTPDHRKRLGSWHVR